MEVVLKIIKYSLRISCLVFAVLNSAYGQTVDIPAPKFSEFIRAGSLEDDMPRSKTVTFPCAGKKCAQTFYPIQTNRPNVTMNALLLRNDSGAKTALLIVPGTDGSEGRMFVKGPLAHRYGAMQYLYDNADVFLDAGISLVATGCPTDQIERYGQCYDDYRKSSEYADDFSRIISHLKEKHGYEKFYVFGHSSGGISTRWLSVNLSSQISGIVNSSIMNGVAGSLASSTVNFDMKKITVPVLNIAHEDDQCPSTPYHIVKNYSNGNLVTVKGGGTSGHVCGGSNHHSFEGRQRGVSKAIVRWIATQQVQTIVDSDD